MLLHTEEQGMSQIVMKSIHRFNLNLEIHSGRGGGDMNRGFRRQGLNHQEKEILKGLRAIY